MVGRLNAFGALLRAFARAKNANVAMIFGISLIPMVLAAGPGLDYARAVMVRQSMGEALDAAALAIGKTDNKPSSCAADSTDTGCTALLQVAQQYFAANYTYNDPSYGPSYGTPTGLTMTIANASVTLSVKDSVPTQIVKWVEPTIPVTASTTVVWGQTKLWVSLVLDNTGSMCEPYDSDSNCSHPNSGDKIAVLKVASHNLLTMLQSASDNPGDVQVAIIPFSKDVDLGSSYSGQSWIDWSAWDAANGSCNISGVRSQSSCTSTHGTWTNNQQGGSHGGNHGGSHGSSGGSCNITGISTQTACQNATGTWTADQSTWNGCVTDRGGVSAPSSHNYDELNTAPTSSDTESYFPAEQYSACPEALLPLTDDWTTLGSEIDGMVANGNTNQTIGLAWGWQALSDSAPLNPGALPAQTQQIIILLSDGLNTQNRWYTSQNSIDTREKAACDKAKAAGVVIYTVFVDINGAQGSSAALQYC
ncbi:MAG TPA: TadE/TadG family type IV pilus assembly protein, partial [Rhizomicrobium sp.]|nr:TadE/TadG family type IV pilus assembly protein [Rhizomicrobium sp.]